MAMSEIEVFGFERLEVWQKAVSLASTIYRLTSDFPKHEMFGLTSQLRRASVSVAANIAEGNTRTAGKDKARLFEIAYGSLSEIVALMRIATEVDLAPAGSLSSVRADAAQICRMLSGLRRSVLPSNPNP
jgi:four helix bundle protein